MDAKQAAAERIQELCRQRDLNINLLAKMSQISSSTIYSMLSGKSRNPGIRTIQLICNGLGITVREFFDDPIFENLENVI